LNAPRQRFPVISIMKILISEGEIFDDLLIEHGWKVTVSGRKNDNRMDHQYKSPAGETF
jgi:hypothetical protein